MDDNSGTFILQELRSFFSDYKDYFSVMTAVPGHFEPAVLRGNIFMKNREPKDSGPSKDVLKNETDAVSARDKKSGWENGGELNILKSVSLNNCKRCRLGDARKNIVFGEGNPESRLMFIGEGPGAEEDNTGRPFVGRAGQLLTKIIESINLKREDVYIANIVKCRPPENRNPLPDEIETCSPFLKEQISIIKPYIICTLGKFSTEFIIGADKGPISAVRGKEFRYGKSIVIPTYHPSYLLRNPSAKKETWEDMKKIRDIYFNI